MKTSKLALIAALSIFILISCGPSQETTPTDTTPPAEVSEPTQVGPSADTILDDQIFNDAVDDRNLENCENIDDVTKKAECIDTVTSLNLIDAAISTLNKEKCNEITLERYKDNCIQQVEKEIEEKEKIELDIALQGEYAEILGIAKADKDPEKCEEISDELQMFNCKYSILSEKAVNTNDISLCDEIGSKDFIEICKREVELIQ